MPELVELLIKAISRAIPANHKKTAAVLSGGIDSSSVVCTTRKLLGLDLPAFTGWYEGDAFDERYWARLAAGHVHTEVKITPQDFVKNFDGFARACKKPYQGMGAFGQYMVAKAISEHGFEVVLSGEGSDELFGGYARQYIVAGLQPPDGYENYQLPEDYPRKLEDALEYDFRHLKDLLAVDDQMLGAFGLEGRAPFTDRELQRWALSLPAGARVGKPVLKKAMRGIVPDEIIARTDKRGFPAPFVYWAQKEPVRSFVLERIGYVPGTLHPWARKWFHELIDVCAGQYGRESWEVAI